MNSVVKPIRREKGLRGLYELMEFFRARLEVPRTIVEIGCYRGEASVVFAELFRKVWCIDPWEPYPRYDNMPMDHLNDFTADDWAEAEREFRRHTLKYDNIEAIKGRSVVVASSWPHGQVDVVYIDALHRYENVKADILAWLPMVRPGGFMSGHDYSQKKWPGVVRAIKEVFPRGIFIDRFSDSSWAVGIS